MKALEVNFDEMQKGFEDVKRDRFDYFLDRETGEVVTVSQDAPDRALGFLYNGVPEDDGGAEVLVDSQLNISAELPEQIFDELEHSLSIVLKPGRYLRIPERNREEAFDSMKSFAQELENMELRKMLLSSLQGTYAFRKFKDALRQHREERKIWHRLNAKKMQLIIREWLIAHGITPIRRRDEKLRKR